jgi:hypothetical protein
VGEGVKVGVTVGVKVAVGVWVTVGVGVSVGSGWNRDGSPWQDDNARAARISKIMSRVRRLRCT